MSDKVYVAVLDEDHKRQNACTGCDFTISLKRGERSLRLCPYCRGKMLVSHIAAGVTEVASYARGGTE